jgi:hypothetical protein
MTSTKVMLDFIWHFDVRLTKVMLDFIWHFDVRFPSAMNAA